VLLVLTKLWLTRAQSLVGIGDSPGDDRLYLQLASHLARGAWLGPYNHLTLVKMPFYPMWVATTFGLNLPLLFGEQLLYAASCWVAVVAVRPLVPGRGWRIAIFALLLSSPWSFADQVMTRAAREGIYASLGLLVLASAIGLALRYASPALVVARWVLLLASSSAALWLTREEGIWILPMVTVALAAGVGKRAPWRRVVLAVLATLLVASVPLLWVAGKNLRHYGMAVLSEETGGPFVDAFGEMVRVRSSAWRPSLPLPRDARVKLYAASPSLAKIRDVVEGPDQPSWIAIGCRVYGLCDDIGAGAIHFSLRDAAFRQGLLTDGPTARDYWLRVAREIHEACRSKRLDCAPPTPGNAVVTGWRREHWRPFIHFLGEGISSTLRITDVRPRPTASTGPLPLLDLFRDMTRERLAGLDARVNRVRVSGTLPSPAGRSLTLGLAGPRGSAEEPSIEHPAADPSRFVVQGYCPEGCSLVIEEAPPRREIARVSLTRPTSPLPGIDLSVDGVTPIPSLPHSERLDERRFRALDALISAYRVLLPPLAVAALIAWLATGLACMRRRREWVVWMVCSAALVGAGTRLGLLAVVSATAFPAMNVLYVSPAPPLFLLFCILALATLQRPGPRLDSRDVPGE
jgi:hypothetical protein